MNTNSKHVNHTSTKISESDVNWDDLEGIGIHKGELEKNGDLEKLLNGEQVSVISLNLILLGIEIVMDATLQIVEENNIPILEICGIKSGPQD